MIRRDRPLTVGSSTVGRGTSKKQESSLFSRIGMRRDDTRGLCPESDGLCASRALVMRIMSLMRSRMLGRGGLAPLFQWLLRTPSQLSRDGPLCKLGRGEGEAPPQRPLQPMAAGVRGSAAPQPRIWTWSISLCEGLLASGMAPKAACPSLRVARHSPGALDESSDL